MYSCIFVCMCVCARAYVCMYVIVVHLRAFLFYIHVCMYACMYVSMYVAIYLLACVFTSVCGILVFVCAYNYTCCVQVLNKATGEVVTMVSLCLYMRILIDVACRC